MSRKTRVVVTGMGVVFPGGHGLEEFERALREGISGIRFSAEMERVGMKCTVGGYAPELESLPEGYFSESRRYAMNELLVYSSVAALDAWRDAGLRVPEEGEDLVHQDTGTIMGIGQSDTGTLADVIQNVNEGRVKRLGSAVVEKTMSSAPTARISELLALGGRGTTLSSACTTGTDAILSAYREIKHGYASVMVAGGVDTSSVYNWAGFDAMKVLNRNMNHDPVRASRPMSASASGFVPGSGAGVLILERLDRALERGARIYGEIVGGSLNGGGHRFGGSMTLPSSDGVISAIHMALEDSGVSPEEVDLINGHLTGTIADPLEIANWGRALGREAKRFPLIQGTKSLFGHCLGAAGAIEGVASLLQLHRGFLHGSLNCEDLHPEIESCSESVVQKSVEREVRVIAKSSFGFGDVNGILLCKKYEESPVDS